MSCFLCNLSVRTLKSIQTYILLIWMQHSNAHCTSVWKKNQKHHEILSHVLHIIIMVILDYVPGLYIASATIEHTLAYDCILYTSYHAYHVPCSVASVASRFLHWAFASSPQGQCRPGGCLSPSTIRINN